MALLKSKETIATESSPGSSRKGGKPNSPAGRPIPGPGLLESTRRLYPNPFSKFPTYLDELTRRYGDIVMFRLPWRAFVVLNRPDHVKEMLVTQQHAFIKSLGARTLRHLLGEGLLTSEEPHHRQMRRIVQPAFHRQRVAKYGQTMVAIAREWVDSHPDGERFDLHAGMSQLTLRIASVTLFGVDAGSDASEVRTALDATLEAYPRAVGPIALIKEKLGLSPVSREFIEARKQLDKLIYGLIAARRKSGSGGDDALSMLLDAEDPETGYRLSDEQVRDEAMTLFLAGHETTANALTWTWYLLSQHPQIEARVHAEVDGVDSFDDPFAALAKLEYTRRVFRESMRLYPPAWIIGREATRSVTLAGDYEIPAKTTVFCAPLIMQRRPELFPDPLRFDPDRWLEPETPFAYIPFGGGARRCIGEEFAWMEASLVLGIIARRMRFVFDSSTPLELAPLVTLRPKGEVLIRVASRGVHGV